MIRLFKYELKRLIFNRFFLGLLIVSSIWSYEVMSNKIILGIANTAPFSGWSYSLYLSKMLPILLVALLFFISFFYSKQEKKVQALTKATSIDSFWFQMLRCGTIINAFLLLSAIPIIYSMWFYKANFYFADFMNLIYPTVIALLPAMFFVMGLGLFGGRYHQGLIFVLMGVLTLISFLPLPYTIDLFGANFYTKYPEAIGTVEPAFFMPINVLIGKFIYGLVGLGMIIMSSIPKKQSSF